MNITNFVVALFYVIFACTGVLAKGQDMEEIFLFSLDDNWYVTILQVLYAICLALTYPLFFLASVKVLLL